MIEHFMLGAIPLAAEGTEVTTTTRMQFHVDVVIGLTREALGANRTLKRLFPCKLKE